MRGVPRPPALYVSLAGAGVLAIAVGLGWIADMLRVWRVAGHLVGWAAILTGLAGVLFQLDSRFFQERTLNSLTYAAPFAAPLAYTGLGFLLLASPILRSGRGGLSSSRSAGSSAILY